MLCSCSTVEMQVEKIEPTTEYVPEEPIPDNPSIGDRIFLENNINLGGSGEIYFTINRAAACKTLEQAGISSEDLPQYDSI